MLRLNAPDVRRASRCTPTRCRCTSAGPGRSGSRRAVQVTGKREAGAMSADALQRLGQSTAEACLGVLEMFAAGKVSVGDVDASARTSKAAFSGVPVPAVAMSVSYVDGVTGGNVFLITLEGARPLAAVDDGHGGAGRARDAAASCPSSSCPPCRRR